MNKSEKICIFFYKDGSRGRIDAELCNEQGSRSQYYTEPLNYQYHFGDELFAYLDDCEMPIDSNLAEQCVWKLTTQRNCMLHFGCDEGEEMAAAYYSIISTVKLHGYKCYFYDAFNDLGRIEDNH